MTGWGVVLAPASGLARRAPHPALAHGKAVVASPRPVRDEVAARLMAALYASGGGPRDGGDAAERLRQGALALRKEHPDADWAAFRVWVPFESVVPASEKLNPDA